MASLKILQIVPSISLVYGGPSQMVLGLSAALAAAGADVTLLTTDSNGDAGQPPLDVPLNTPIAQAGYRIRYFRCAPFRRYKFSLGLLHWLNQNAKHYDLAHIHALFSPVSTAAATIARLHNLSYILRPLGTLDPADLQKKAMLKCIYGSLLEKANLAGAAAIHFTSAQEARVSERFGATTRDVIIPLGVNLTAESAESRWQESPEQLRRRWHIEVDRPLILYMSRIDPKKGLDVLLPALEALLTEGCQFHLVLAGSNPQDPVYENQIHHHIQNSPLRACTTVTGFVEGVQKHHLLQAADLFVLPSYYENFGIAVAEAMMAGLPVVISKGVYIWENILEARAGWVVPCAVAALHPKALQEQLRVALKSPQTRKVRGENAQCYAKEHYSWDTIAQQTLQLYSGFCTS